MKKSLIFNLLFIIAMAGLSLPVNAEETSTLAPIDDVTMERISRIGFVKMFNQDPKAEIDDFFQKHTKYSTNKKLQRLQEMYADSFVNADGFDKKTYFDMVEKTWELYPVMNYSYSIKDIILDGDYAIVQLKENAQGEAKDSFENINEKGIVESESYTFYYLQKISKDWKILSSTIISETTALKYGDAKNANVTISAPPQVKAGECYTASLNLVAPKDTMVLASISTEPIVFPQKQPQDVFRNVKKDGILERVFNANTDGYNEYAIASVGITKPTIKPGKDIKIDISGMAFVMSRINVLNVKAPIRKAKNETHFAIN
ncbi:MAG: hypothetical protein PHV37_06540 [Candidatus Gastranaerophilales bacterium]|nr:hypothetical protein [Candidatus Gastranaerophilales bacterium]